MGDGMTVGSFGFIVVGPALVTHLEPPRSTCGRAFRRARQASERLATALAG